MKVAFQGYQSAKPKISEGTKKKKQKNKKPPSNNKGLILREKWTRLIFYPKFKWYLWGVLHKIQSFHSPVSSKTFVNSFEHTCFKKIFKKIIVVKIDFISFL